MLDAHQRLVLKTTTNENLEIEVNFSKDPKIAGCKVLRFHLGTDGAFDIKQDDLVSVLMAIGTESTQKKLLPLQITNERHIDRLIGFKWVCSRDFRKGDEVVIQAPWRDVIPTHEEMLSGNFKRGASLDVNVGTHKNNVLIPK